MPRKYKPVGRVKYQNYSPETLTLAMQEVQNLGFKVSAVAKKYNIPERTLRNKLNGVHTKKSGGQCIFNDVEEAEIEANLITCAEYGMPLCSTDIKLFTSTP